MPLNKFGITVYGVDEVKSIFKNLSSSQQRVIKKEFEESLKETSYLMRRDAPVDQARLRNSITYEMNSDLTGRIYTNVFYSPFQEFGTTGTESSANLRVPGIYADYAKQFKGSRSAEGTDPIVALTAWVKRKGLAATYSVNRYNIKSRTGVKRARRKGQDKIEKNIAFLIWRKIRRQGIKAQPFMFSDKAGVLRNDQITNLVVKRISSGIKLLLKQ